ncbi:MAG TPA: HD domain-containing protein [Thermoplasmata archaeon]|nr:HD domain-containing protein [Thermoplasmata archaeon]
MSDLYRYDKKQEEQTMIEADIGRRKKEQFVENLREGDVINDFFAVKIKNPLRPYRKGVWFDFVAADKTGEIIVKFWGGDNRDRVKRLYDSFSTGDVVQIRSGNVEIYEEKPQISINETTGGLRRCSPSEYDVSDFIPALEENQIKSLYDEVTDEIQTIENEQLKGLLDLFFSDPSFVKDFTHSPSAIMHHHNYVGGNLEHTVSVIRLCNTICEMYPDIDRDLVITGAILHDVGKLREYKTTAAIDKTEEGNFIGHIVIGDRWVREKIVELKQNGKDFDQDLENRLCHMILSHHGKYEWGSPRMPKLLEACILHQADLMDSQVKNYMQLREEGRKLTDEDWAFMWDADLGRKRIMHLGDR